MYNKMFLACALTVLMVGSAFGKQIRVEGATVLTQDEINSVIGRYQNGPVHPEDLVAVINELNKLYQDKGYLTSGVVFPEQSAGDIVRLQAVETGLGKINITSDGRLQTSFVESVIRSEVRDPLDVKSLQSAFNRLERDDTIQAVKGRLEPGTNRGESVLNLEVVEADAFSVVASGNNYTSPSVGDEQLQVQLSHINLTGHSDVLKIGVNHTDGMDSGSIFYSFPINQLNSRLAVYYSTGDTLVVEAPFDEIDIESEVDTRGISLEKLIVDSRARTISFSLGFESKTSETSLLGLPFDFSQGSVEGESEAAIMIAALNFQQRSEDQAFSAKITYRKGLDALDATILTNGRADGEFDLWQLQANYVRLIAPGSLNWTFNLALNTQFTGDTLQSFERFPLGGHNSVRGFRENQVLRDEAWEVRAQLNIPLIKTNDAVGHQLMVFPFFDAGEGKNAEFQANVRQSVELSSVGLGIRYQIAGFTAVAEWAKRLDEEQKQANTLQDKGVHLGVSYEF